MSQDDHAAPVGFDRTFEAAPEVVQRLTPLVRRIVAANPGPFTFTGTCTYIVGNGSVAILDPGPADERHVAALLDGVRGETVAHVLVTHTHRDHSPAAARIRAETGATVLGCVPYRNPAGQPESGADASHDRNYAPDVILRDGDTLAGAGFRLTALARPGHSANHLAYALADEKALFSGDHVMGWSTSVVAPPDGSMAAYMASLEKLLGRDEATYWPGHGGPVTQPRRFVKGLIRHRRQREAAILARVRAGDADIPAIVARLYGGLDPALRGAAGLSVLAHLEDLAGRRLLVCEGPRGPGARFRPA